MNELPESDFLSRDQPFGPASADDLPLGLLETPLYDDHNEIDTVLRRKPPVFLIGRRGSGKTAFLKAIPQVGELSVDLSSPELLEQIGNTISALRMDRSGDFVERVSLIWEACFWAGICAKVWSNTCDLRESDCPPAFAFGKLQYKPRESRGTASATRFLQAVRKSAATAGDYSSLGALLDETRLNGVPLWMARASLEDAATRTGCQASVSLDSLEQYSGLLYQGGALMNTRGLALQGLFRAAAESGRRPNSLYHVRVSFPAELWHFYSQLSSNPLKDFESSIILHWDNQELLNVAGRRFLAFLRIHEPVHFANLPRGRNSGRSTWVQSALEYFMPTTLTNALGHKENSVAYLIRHTQLVPRHFLTVLNAVFGEFDRLRPGIVTESHIRQRVADAEATIIAGISTAYKILYPQLDDRCHELIPALPFTFSPSEFQRKFNASRKGDYHEDLAMLMEVGAVGRVAGETPRYIRGDFEYLHANRLNWLPEDRLCLHPIFAAAYDSLSLRRPQERDSLPILPLGSDPEHPEEYSRYVQLNN